VDYLLALERLEALRYAHFVKPGGTIILNDHKVEPVRMADSRPYPDEGIDFLGQKGFKVVVVPATTTAIEIGNYRAANVILLGTLAAHLDIPQTVWDETLRERIPGRILTLNQKAFAAGREFAPSPV
jgi:indolepyruvate ferredoxin oxidoreductase beta subunit